MYQDELGWVAVPDLLSASDAEALALDCERALAQIGDDVRTGDKPVSGTHRLVQLIERVPAVTRLAALPAITGVVTRILGSDVVLQGATFRNPQPGFGSQRLHADAVPMTAIGPAQSATAIVALVDFTDLNGATRLVPGSHVRPDLQRLAGNLDDHPDAITLTGLAGTAFIYSGHILHSGTRNNSAHPRPALQLNWQRV